MDILHIKYLVIRYGLYVCVAHFWVQFGPTAECNLACRVCNILIPSPWCISADMQIPGTDTLMLMMHVSWHNNMQIPGTVVGGMENCQNTTYVTTAMVMKTANPYNYPR